MNAKFSPGQKLNYLFASQELPILSLNQPTFEQANIKEHDAEQAVLDALPAAVDALAATPDASLPPAKPHAAHARDGPLLQPRTTRRRSLPANEFGQLLAHSYSSNGGWYVLVVFAGYQMQASSGGGTTHFSPWSYDRHVPLGFYGAPFAPGIYHGRVGPSTSPPPGPRCSASTNPRLRWATSSPRRSSPSQRSPTPHQERQPNREAQYGGHLRRDRAPQPGHRRQRNLRLRHRV